MLSRAQIKDIRSLHLKKYRQRKREFFAEGTKVVSEILNADFDIKLLVATSGWLTDHQSLLKGKEVSFVETDEKGMKAISAMHSPSEALVVCSIPEVEKSVPDQGWHLIVDGIKDPGNLGTMIRICDWFGIRSLISSSNSVDVFNPKVIQATMGSISRIPVQYWDIEELLNESKLPAFAADMQGKAIHEVEFPEHGMLIIGSESHGLSENTKSLVQNLITIPKHGQAESLNAAVATGIILSRIFP